MSEATDNLMAAMQRAMKVRPKVGGFPYLAESLRLAGVTRNVWLLPGCTSLYATTLSAVATQDQPLISGIADVAPFDRAALIAALRVDQAGQSTFAEFLAATWAAGVVRFEVDFEARHVTYHGAAGEKYVEDYPAVDLATG